MTIEFKALYLAYLDCRKRKRKTMNAQRYDMNLLDNLFDTQASLKARSYRPARSIRFVATKPKAREIHAADFSDRVVHHLLVPRLEKIFEPIFIHNVYSNRVGKGTHKAVDRLQALLHSIGNQGWFLQLDIANFFNSIDRPILFALLQQQFKKSVRRYETQPTNSRALSAQEADFLRWLCHVILKHNPNENAHYRGDPALLTRVPLHKQLGNIGENKGLPIGNLTSQFFANVYLNQLDQFIKHQLKCAHYVRYVDDFVLLAKDKDTLLLWREQIIEFLQTTLQLSLKNVSEPKPISAGIDFLGYIIYPHYRLVRRRVVGNLREKLVHFQKTLLTGSIATGYVLTVKIDQIEQLRATLASYDGHFKHANSYRLRQKIWSLFPWLDLLFEQHLPLRLSPLPLQRGKTIKSNCFLIFRPLRRGQPDRAGGELARGLALRLRYEPKPQEVHRYYSQIRYFQQQYPYATLHIQRGKDTDIIDNPPRIFQQLPPDSLRKAVTHVHIHQVGFMKDGLKRRRVTQLTIHSGVQLCPVS